MIRLNCFFQAKKGKYAEALEAALTLVAESQRQEVTMFAGRNRQTVRQ